MNWIKAIKQNSNSALSTLYNEHKLPCLGWLKKNYNLPHEDAIEVFQLSVVILYENVISGKLKTLSSSVNTYLFSIARNKALELCRRRQKDLRQRNTKQVIIDYLTSDEDGIAHKHLLEDKIESAMQLLNEIGDPCKKLVSLFYLSQKSITEITEEMAYKNTDTTKNQKYKCIKRLQSMMKSNKGQLK